MGFGRLGFARVPAAVAATAVLLTGCGTLGGPGPGGSAAAQLLPATAILTPPSLGKAVAAWSATAISTGDFHSCALAASGAVYCWGSNTFGQLGNGTTAAAAVPIRVAGGAGARAVQLSTGANHSCAVRRDGTVACWGDNSNGQLGRAEPFVATRPLVVPGLADVVAVAAGGEHTCALGRGGAVHCWGANDQGQLGIGTVTGSAAPVAVTELPGPARQLTAGGDHTCAVLGPRARGTAHCWGANAAGQLGNGGIGGNMTIPMPVLGIGGRARPVLRLAAGYAHTCAVLAQPAAPRCWGANASGQLGTGAARRSGRPAPVQGLPAGTVRTLAAGRDHTCATVQPGRALCWGRNGEGQLGSADPGAARRPRPVPDLRGATAIAAGRWHTCALAGSAPGSRAHCWGNSIAGAVGSAIGPRVPPRPVVIGTSPLHGVGAVAGGDRTCARVWRTARRSAPTLACWGAAALGDGQPWGSALARTVRAPVADRPHSVAAGGAHACAVGPDGVVRCWGGNSAGQAVPGRAALVLRPQPVPGPATARAVAAGEQHTCALARNGTVRCWGRSADGQLGRSNPTRPVPGLRAAAITAGSRHTCAIRAAGAPGGGAAGTVACWGLNHRGQLGNGTTIGSSKPVPVRGLRHAVSVAAGYAHTCAVLRPGRPADSRVACWGGLTGDIAYGPRPRLVPGLAGASAVVAGDGFSCALIGAGTAAGQVRCWGVNADGTLGDGSRRDARAAVRVAGIRSARGLTAGPRHACAVLTGGNLRCWGWGYDGQLGDGLLAIAAAPRPVLSGAGALSRYSAAPPPPRSP